MSGSSGFSVFVGGSFTTRDHIASDPIRVAVPMCTQEFDSLVARPNGHADGMREALAISGTSAGGTTIQMWRNES